MELAGQIAEMARDTLRNDFRRIDPTQARVVVLEAAKRVLGAFPESLSQRAAHDLEALGVDVRTAHAVTRVDASGVHVVHHGHEDRIDARTVLWAAGVAASPIARKLAIHWVTAGRAVAARAAGIPRESPFGIATKAR